MSSVGGSLSQLSPVCVHCLLELIAFSGSLGRLVGAALMRPSQGSDVWHWSTADSNDSDDDEERSELMPSLSSGEDAGSAASPSVCDELQDREAAPSPFVVLPRRLGAEADALLVSISRANFSLKFPE